MAATASPGEVRDPGAVWGVFRGVLRNLVTSSPHDQEKYVAHISQMVETFPQILVPTTTWPDTEGRGARRDAFISALLRRLVQCQAQPSPSCSEGCLAVESLVLATLLRHCPPRWHQVVGHLQDLWHRLAVTALRLEPLEGEQEQKEVDGLTVSSVGVAVRLLPAPLPKDEDFPPDLNFLVLSCPEVVERLQLHVTSLLLPLPGDMALYRPSLLPALQRTALLQLQDGEAPLKTVTLQLLAALHSSGAGCGPLELWVEESMWLGELVGLLVGEQLRLEERQELGGALAALLRVLVARWQEGGREQEKEQVLLAQHLLPPWLQVMRKGHGERLAESEGALEEVVAVLVSCPRVDEAETREVLEVALAQDCSSLHLLAVQLAWREVLASRELEGGSWGGRAGKRRLEGEVGERLLLCQCSPSLARLLAQYEGEGRLASLTSLLTFTAVIRSLLRLLLATGCRGELELVNRSLLHSATSSLAAQLNSPGGGQAASDLLDCLEPLLVCGHLWPGAAHPASDIASIQQSWAGLLSLPWSLGQDCKDLRLEPGLDLSPGARLAASWPQELKARSLALLLLLPRHLCPRWRLAVARAAWTSRCQGLVTGLPCLALLGPGGQDLAKEVVATVVSEPSCSSLVALLAQAAPLYLCSLARCVEPRPAAGREGGLAPSCMACSPEVREGRPKTPTKGLAVSAREVEPLLKLLGHPEAGVRRSMVGLLGPFTQHTLLSEDAVTLWLNCITDSDRMVRSSFGQQAASLLDCRTDTLTSQATICDTVAQRLVEARLSLQPGHLDTFLVCLVEVSSSPALQGPARRHLQDCLLHLFFSPASNVTAYARALVPLQAALSSDKRFVVRWCAQAMCRPGTSPREIISWLCMLCPQEQSQGQFVTAHIHHFLPTVAFHSACLPTAGQGEANNPLAVIADYTGVKMRNLLLEHFPIIFVHLAVSAESSRTLARCLDFVKSHTAVDLAGMIKANRQRILVELLCLYNLHKSRVMHALNLCATADDNFVKPKKPDSKGLPVAEVARYVGQCLMAVLSTFNVKLSNKEVPTEDKLQILKSLNDLMMFLGHDNLLERKHAVLECIKMAGSLQDSGAEVQAACIQLWDSLVHSLSLHSLADLLPQVLVGLLPHLATSPAKAAAIYYFLLVENGEKFSEQSAPFLMLLDGGVAPGMDKVVAVARGGAGLEFKDQLLRLLRYMQHESVEVRHQTFRTLSGLLDKNMGALQGLLLISDRTNPVVTSLVQALMAAMSCREPDTDLRLLAATCLGKIGAIDPGKMEFLVEGGQEDGPESVLDLFSTTFCSSLLKELVRAQGSCREPLLAEVFSYSVQEVLKVYEISLVKDGPDSFTWKVWRSLADSTQEILAPLLESKYSYEKSSTPTSSSPVYDSAQGSSYRDWLVNWSAALLPSLHCPRAAALFTACLPALRKDLRVAEFLLPNLVVAVLSDSTDQDMVRVMAEIGAVFDKKGKEDEVADSNLKQLVALAMFSVLDHISAWLRHKSANLLAATRKDPEKLSCDETKAALGRSKEYGRVMAFRQNLPTVGIANLSYQVGAYHRSAASLDQYLRAKGGTARTMTARELSSLQQLYTSLQEPDLVLGVAAVREQEPDLEDLITQHVATGNYQDALCCYEARGEGGEVTGKGMVECYLMIDQPATAASLAAGLVAQHPGLADDLGPLQAEAAWQLGRWEEVDTFTRQVDEEGGLGWQVGLGRTLASVHGQDWPGMRACLQLVRQELLEPLSAGSEERGAYQRGYTHVSRLALLYEVERLADKFLAAPEREVAASTSGASELLQELSDRLKYTLQSWGSLEPVHRVRRAVLGLAVTRLKNINSKVSERLNFEVGESWLRSAQVARECGQLQEAYSFLLEVKRFHHIEFFLEASQLAWARGRHTEAITALRKGLQDAFPFICQAWQANDAQAALAAAAKLEPDAKKVCWRGKLLLAQYLEEASSVAQETIQKNYVQAVNLDKTSADVHFRYARYLDRNIQKYSEEAWLQHADIISSTCTFYLKSTMRGPQHLHHCLPRLLSIWLDLAASLQEAQARKNKDAVLCAVLDHASSSLAKLATTMREWVRKAPSYYLLTAAPQLVSRICHGHAETWLLLKSLLVNVLCRHPQQTFWHLVSVSKNSNPTRKARCNEIFCEAIKAKPELDKFLRDALALAKKIDELCELKTGKRETRISLKDAMKSLPLLVNSSSFSPLILPNQRNMVVCLPTADVSSLSSLLSYNPFPDGTVTIAGIQDEVILMQSLVQPKKITFRGSDGRLHPFLAKPKDDLRRDCRLMDFCFLLNKLFREDAGSRKRDLHIRTYTVVPTNENNGLIEWVNNLRGLRPIIIQKHKERGLNIGNKWPSKYQSDKKDPLDRKKKMLDKCVDDQQGAVFADWFASTFHDPQAWLMARMAFTRTTAVMSMVGYIIGLGDRHLENINVDTTNGQTFHVDMNCLFNKGETFDWPEVVPFRLSHNMVDAFGPLGVEGPFRISCEVALAVMRKERDVLMSVLRPFVFDPLVDWTKGRGSLLAGEPCGEGKESLRRVEERLTGTVSSVKGKGKEKSGPLSHPLSVAGQVAHVVEQATDKENLAQMYWGWAPYL